MSERNLSLFAPFTAAVYGTLRYGAGANSLLKGCKYLGKGKVDGNLYNLGPYPALKLNKGSGEVVVDLYEVTSEETLISLDRYEGFRDKYPEESLYIRENVLTVKEKVPVTVYVYNGEVRDEHRIETGDWFDVKN